MMTVMALRRLVCSLLFLITNLCYSVLAVAGHVDPVGAIIWGIIGFAWVWRIGRYRRHHHKGWN
jgi:hypothetical protein